jgi:hypothetical protein
MGILRSRVVGCCKGHMTGLTVVEFRGYRGFMGSFCRRRRRFVIVVSLLFLFLSFPASYFMPLPRQTKRLPKIHIAPPPLTRQVANIIAQRSTIIPRLNPQLLDLALRHHILIRLQTNRIRQVHTSCLDTRAVTRP